MLPRMRLAAENAGSSRPRGESSRSRPILLDRDAPRSYRHRATTTLNSLAYSRLRFIPPTCYNLVNLLQRRFFIPRGLLAPDYSSPVLGVARLALRSWNNPWPYLEFANAGAKPRRQHSTLRAGIIIVGAGAFGLAMAIEMAKRGIWPIQVIEATAEIGTVSHNFVNAYQYHTPISYDYPAPGPGATLYRSLFHVSQTKRKP